MKYCCPKTHYGVSCEPCPRDVNNNVCSGRGKCDGDGLRSGKGICVCQQGYIGDICDTCADNYFKNDKDKCQKCSNSCEMCVGPKGECIKCKIGWILNHEDECVDLDECLGADMCQSNEYCENIEGSFLCKPCDDSCVTCAGPGRTECTSCSNENMFWSGMCLDNKSKELLVLNALQRILLYLGLFIILFFISRKSKSLASLVVLILALYIYASEANMEVSNFSVFFQLIRG